MRNIFWEKGEFKWWILLLCAYHFFPFITTKGSILLYIWAYIVPLAYLALNINYLKKIVSAIIYSEAMIAISGIVLLSCASILIPVFHNTGDFTYFTGAIMTMIKILIRMLFLVVVIVKNIPNATKETFMKYFIFSCCLYICSTIIMLIVPSIRSMFWELVKESESAKAMALEARYQTRYGWGGFSGFEYTFKCVMGILFINYLVDINIGVKKVWYWVVTALFLFVGTLFYGRIGSVVAVLILLLMLLNLLMRRPKILSVIVVGGVIGIIGLLILQSRNEAVQAWFQWAFDLFVTFIKTGKMETGSTNVLFERMLFIPEIKTMLIGDGLYSTADGYYMSTDAGIMRPVLFGGILFAVLRYLSVYAVLFINCLKEGIKREEKNLYFLLLLICIVFEVKGEIIFSCLPIFLWLLVIKAYNRREKDGKRIKLKKTD